MTKKRSSVPGLWNGVDRRSYNTGWHSGYKTMRQIALFAYAELHGEGADRELDAKIIEVSLRHHAAGEVGDYTL